MTESAIYLLIPVMAILLVSAQAMWGIAIKHHHLVEGGIMQTGINLLTSPGIWAGALLYIAATLVYFMMLSRGKFFIIQITMAGIATILSTILASVLFKEALSLENILGMLIVIIGLFFVMR